MSGCISRTAASAIARALDFCASLALTSLIKRSTIHSAWRGVSSALKCMPDPPCSCQLVQPQVRPKHPEWTMKPTMPTINKATIHRCRLPQCLWHRPTSFWQQHGLFADVVSVTGDSVSDPLSDSMFRSIRSGLPDWHAAHSGHRALLAFLCTVKNYEANPGRPMFLAHSHRQGHSIRKLGDFGWQR